MGQASGSETGMNHVSTSIRYGIIGVGMMGQEHFRNILVLSGAEVTAIADDVPASIETTLNNMELAEAGCTKHLHVFGGDNAAQDLYVANVCDLCIIATPNMTHARVLELCSVHAPGNLHILVEKPMCTTLKDCRQVVKWSKARSGLTLCGLEYSFMSVLDSILAESTSSRDLTRSANVSVGLSEVPRG